MTPFEKAMMNMTPAQRKKANAGLSEMMGMPPKKKKATTKTKRTSKKK